MGNCGVDFSCALGVRKACIGPGGLYGEKRPQPLAEVIEDLRQMGAVGSSLFRIFLDGKKIWEGKEGQDLAGVFLKPRSKLVVFSTAS